MLTCYLQTQKQISVDLRIWVTIAAVVPDALLIRIFFNSQAFFVYFDFMKTDITFQKLTHVISATVFNGPVWRKFESDFSFPHFKYLCHWNNRQLGCCCYKRKTINENQFFLYKPNNLESKVNQKLLWRTRIANPVIYSNKIFIYSYQQYAQWFNIKKIIILMKLNKKGFWIHLILKHTQQQW